MTITNQVAGTIGLGDGANRTWTFDFLVPSSGGDALVRVGICNTNPTIPSSSELDPSEYEITGTDDPDGGIVTYPKDGSLTPPLALGYNIYIVRGVPYSQVFPFNIQNFNPASVENAADQDVIEIQQLAYELGRSLTVPDGSNMTAVQYVLALVGNVLAPISGAPIFTIRTISTSVDVATTDFFVLFAGAGATTHNLPAASATSGQMFVLINTVDKNRHIAGIINNVTSFDLGAQWQVAIVASNGSQYYGVLNLTASFV